MERVLILGCGGAGKSTLARQLGAQTGLPVVHLDQGWWLPGWKNPPEEAFDRWVEEMLAGEWWIIDGNYKWTLEVRLCRADTVGCSGRFFAEREKRKWLFAKLWWTRGRIRDIVFSGKKRKEKE